MTLSSYVSLYIPTRDKSGQAVDNSVVLHNAKVQMASMFGGFSQSEITGGWVNENQQLIEERVFVVKSFCEILSAENLSEVIKLAKLIKEELNQECVSVETHEGLMFV